jgi:hypothetical protein
LWNRLRVKGNVSFGGVGAWLIALVARLRVMRGLG